MLSQFLVSRDSVFTNDQPLSGSPGSCSSFRSHSTLDFTAAALALADSPRFLGKKTPAPFLATYWETRRSPT